MEKKNKKWAPRLTRRDGTSQIGLFNSFYGNPSEKIKGLEKENYTLKKDKKRLSSKNSEWKQDYNLLQEERDSFAEENQRLRKENENLKAEIEALKKDKKILELEKKNSQLNQKNTQLNQALLEESKTQSVPAPGPLAMQKFRPAPVNTVNPLNSGYFLDGDYYCQYDSSLGGQGANPWMQYQHYQIQVNAYNTYQSQPLATPSVPLPPLPSVSAHRNYLQSNMLQNNSGEQPQKIPVLPTQEELNNKNNNGNDATTLLSIKK